MKLSEDRSDVVTTPDACNEPSWNITIKLPDPLKPEQKWDCCAYAVKNMAKTRNNPNVIQTPCEKFILTL